MHENICNASTSRADIMVNRYISHTLQTDSKMAGRNDDFAPVLRDFVIDNIRIGNQIGRGANGRIFVRLNGKEL